MTLAGFTVDALEGPAALAKALPAWQALANSESEATIFQAPQMCEAWHAGAGADESLLLLLARRGDQPVGLLPLALRQRVVRGLRLRVLASASPRADMLAPGERDTVGAAFAGWLAGAPRRWDVIELDDLRPTTAHALVAAFGGQRGLVIEGPVAAPSEAYIDTRAGWAAYLQARGPHFRHRLKPQTRKIERLGPVTLRRFEGPAAETAYDEFLRLEPRSWKSRADDTRLPARDRAAFLALIRAGGEVRPDLLFLDVNGQPAAAMLSLTHCYRYYLFITYFDDRLRAWYPGRRLFLEAILHAYERPALQEISFVGAYPFARAWSDGLREYRSLKVWGGSWRARLAQRVAPRLEDAPTTAPETAHA